MPVRPIAERRAFAAGVSALLHLAGLGLLLLWPTSRPAAPPRETLTTIAFPTPTPSPSVEPAPTPPATDTSRLARDAGAQGGLATPIRTLAAALPIAQPSIAPELDVASGSDVRIGGGTGGQGPGSAGLGKGPGGGGKGTAGQGSAAEWIGGTIRRSDYPRSARAAGEEGRVGTEVSVDRTGRPSGCTVVRSSGSAELDRATCRLILRRFRFEPARDASGRAVQGIVGYDQAWNYRRLDAE